MATTRQISLSQAVDASHHSADERLQQEVENHAAALALCFTDYNFGRVHQTLRVTPAMEAVVTDQVWSVEEMVPLLA